MKKMEMIDLHSHILPGVDDGSGSMEETLEMLSMAYEQGFRKIIATPHYRAEGRNKSRDELNAVLESVKKQAKARFPGLSLGLGQEVQYFDDIIDALDCGAVLTLAGTRYVLVEFWYSASWTVIYQGVRKLLAGGYCPIIAHIERYPELTKKGRLEQLINAGGILQMNFSSLSGSVFSRRTRWCRQQILNGNVHILCTDCHNTRSRPPKTEEALTWMRKKCSGSRIRQLTCRNAKKILKEKM